MRRTALALLLVPVGAWTALCLVVLSERWWGLPVGIAASVVAAYAAPRGRARVAFTLGWVTLLGLVVLGRPEGDWAIASDWRGHSMLACGLFLLVFALSTLARPAHGRSEAGESADLNLG
ncbi:conserved membrane hypothetical protein [metagenome]|uniref:Uncharacterized protein n=1 Tax=metagenome TaxID=256318 RepID=A0A2P2C2P9_9ZZZZ